jgi:hypothetical protein
MGVERKSLTVYATVSRHNSERDERDDELWDLLRTEIAAVANRPTFRPIRAELD